MNKITIITALSTANSAFANRLKCICHGLIANGVRVNVVAVASNEEVIMSFLNAKIPFELLSSAKNKYFRYLFSIVRLSFIVRKYDNIFALVTEPLLLRLLFVFKRKDAKVFHERTEFPELTLKGKLLDCYLKSCLKFNHIFVITTALKGYFISKGVESNRISILPMLVDPSRFEKPGASVTQYDFQYMAYCGDMGSNKDGLLNLINSFAIFCQSNADIKLLLIGDTKRQQDMDNIKYKVRELHLEGRAIFTGRKKADEIPSLLLSAKILLLARPNNVQAKYGFPTKLGEYLSTSKPVIVTDTGDISLYLKDGLSCNIVTADDDLLFAERMLDVVSNYQKALAIAEEGHKCVQDCFNPIVQTLQIKELL